MAKIALATYTIRMRHRMKPGNALILNNTHLPISFAEVFREFANGLRQAHDHNIRAKSILSTLELNEDMRAGLVWGRVNAGAYGMGRDVVKSDTNEPAYRVAPNEAVLYPFYFMLSAPPESTRAIYVLQRHGNTGVHSTFTNAFRNFFAFRHPSLIFDVKRQIPPEVLEYLQRGELKRVELTRYKVPRELEEAVHLGGNTEGKVVVRTSITARERGAALPMPDWVARVVQRRVQGANMFEQEVGQDVEEGRIQLTFRYKGNERTLDMSRPDSLAPYVDVTEEVSLDAEGHPDLEQLHRAATRLRDEIVQQIGLG